MITQPNTQEYIMEYDYTMARRIGSQDEWERIVDSDYPCNEDGTPAGPDDTFKLEHSGWAMHIEFKPKGDDE